MSGKRDLNFSLYSGRLTHPPEMMQYNTGHGHMLCFSLAIHSDAPSDKIDNPMFLDVKVTGASPELHQTIIHERRPEVRVRGELQSRTFKKQDRIQRTYYLHQNTLRPRILSRPKDKTTTHHHTPRIHIRATCPSSPEQGGLIMTTAQITHAQIARACTRPTPPWSASRSRIFASCSFLLSV